MPAVSSSSCRPSRPTVGSELDQVSGDLVGDPAGHFQPLRYQGDISDCRAVLDLQDCQGGGSIVKAPLVPLQRPKRLVGACKQGRRVLKHVTLTRR